MKVLVRDGRTQRYYADAFRWVAKPAQARDFEMVGLAVEFAVSTSLTDAQVVLSFDDPLQELVLPVVPGLELNS